MTERRPTLDDLDTEHARLPSVLHPGVKADIDALHAGISRRDWQATEQAANALRDRFKL